jgi:hypothetical protein
MIMLTAGDPYGAPQKRNKSISMFTGMKHMKAYRYAALAVLLLSANVVPCIGSEEEDHAEEEHKPLDTNGVWGYSFLFSFLSCLPSACAIIICLVLKVSTGEKVINVLMAFASGVSLASTHQIKMYSL